MFDDNLFTLYQQRKAYFIMNEKERLINNVMNELKPNTYTENSHTWQTSKKALGKLTNKELSNLLVLTMCQNGKDGFSAMQRT